MKARSIARELALLGISQLTDNPEKMQAASGQERGIALPAKALDALLMKALKALSADAQETLDTAEGELQRSERLILESETRTVDQDEVRSRIQPAVPLIESAINRAGSTLEPTYFLRSRAIVKKSSLARRSLVSASTHLENGDRLLLEHALLERPTLTMPRVQIQLAISVVRSAVY